MVLNQRSPPANLDNLDSEGVIVRVAPLIEGKAKRLLPVDGDAVEVLVSQRQPDLQMERGQLPQPRIITKLLPCSCSLSEEEENKIRAPLSGALPLFM